jgi:hypothetical protein
MVLRDTGIRPGIFDVLMLSDDTSSVPGDCTDTTYSKYVKEQKRNRLLLLHLSPQQNTVNHEDRSSPPKSLPAIMLLLCFLSVLLLLEAALAVTKTS